MEFCKIRLGVRPVCSLDFAYIVGSCTYYTYCRSSPVQLVILLDFFCHFRSLLLQFDVFLPPYFVVFGCCVSSNQSMLLFGFESVHFTSFRGYEMFWYIVWKLGHTRIQSAACSADDVDHLISGLDISHTTLHEKITNCQCFNVTGFVSSMHISFLRPVIRFGRFSFLFACYRELAQSGVLTLYHKCLSHPML